MVVNIVSSPVFYFIILLIAILSLRERRVKPLSLVILPIVMLIVVIPLVSNQLNNIFNITIIIVGLIIGLIIGVVRGRLYKVKINTEGSLVIKGSYLAVFVWLAIIVIKLTAESLLSQYVGLNLLISALLMLTLGALISRRIYIYWRYLNLKATKNS